MEYTAIQIEDRARKALRDLVEGKRTDVAVVRYECLDAFDKLREVDGDSCPTCGTPNHAAG